MRYCCMGMEKDTLTEPAIRGVYEGSVSEIRDGFLPLLGEIHRNTEGGKGCDPAFYKGPRGASSLQDMTPIGIETMLEMLRYMEAARDNTLTGRIPDEFSVFKVFGLGNHKKRIACVAPSVQADGGEQGAGVLGKGTCDSCRYYVEADL